MRIQTIKTLVKQILTPQVSQESYQDTVEAEAVLGDWCEGRGIPRRRATRQVLAVRMGDAQEACRSVERALADVAVVAQWIRVHGPIPAARCSSAQARGRAKRYVYWGATQYEIRLRKRDGRLVAVAVSRASSDRRSLRLARQDTEQLAERVGGIVVESIGELYLADLWAAADWVRARAHDVAEVTS